MYLAVITIVNSTISDNQAGHATMPPQDTVAVGI